MYRDTTSVEPEMYDYTSNNWSHWNSNEKLKEKSGNCTRKTLDRFTTKDSYTWNITHNTESTAVWSLKREWWGSPVVQEKYQEEKTCDKRHPYRIIIIIIIIWNCLYSENFGAFVWTVTGYWVYGTKFGELHDQLCNYWLLESGFSFAEFWLIMEPSLHKAMSAPYHVAPKACSFLSEIRHSTLSPIRILCFQF